MSPSRLAAVNSGCMWGIKTPLDEKHAIAHSKVMVIDSATLITGSFNFTKAAEEKNAENLLVIKDTYELVWLYETNIALHSAYASVHTPESRVREALAAYHAQPGARACGEQGLSLAELSGLREHQSLQPRRFRHRGCGVARRIPEGQELPRGSPRPGCKE